MRFDRRRVEPGEELRALPEDGRLGVDLLDVARRDAARHGEDEPDRDLDLGGDDQPRAAVERPGQRLERLEDGPGAAGDSWQDGDVDLACREPAKQPVERRELHRVADASRSARREGAGQPLIAGPRIRPHRRSLFEAVIGDRCVHVVLRRRGENEKAPLRRFGEGGLGY